MPIRTLPPDLSRFPKPREDKRPPDLKGRKESQSKGSGVKDKEFRRKVDALYASFGHVLQKPREAVAGDSLIFILPLYPVGLNGTLHWARASELKGQYRNHFEELRLRKLLPSTPWEPFKKARIQATFFVKGLNDMDNLLSRVKISIDCIVHGGWIKDDSPDCLTWDAMPKQVVNRKRNAYLILEIWRDETEEPK